MDSFRQSRNQLFGLLLVLLISTGCAAAYREPSLAADATASLKATAPVWIVTIDGRKVSRSTLSGSKQFRVSPGLHLVEVEYSGVSQPVQESYDGVAYTVRHRTMSKSNVPLRFLATAGTAYFVKAERSEDSWKPIITDIPEPTPP